MWTAAKEGSGNGEGNTVNVTEVLRGDGVLNFMWVEEDGVSQGSHYWELTLTNAERAFFGVTSKDYFKEGYRLRGLFFGGPGNVSDGAGCLHSAWGPGLHRGDTVGVLVEFVDDMLNVSFFVNKKALGKAFSLPLPFSSPVFPVASFGSGPQQASIMKMDAPSEVAETSTPQPQGLDGQWAIVNPYEQANIVKLIVKQEGPDSHAILAKCANSIRTLATKSPSGQWSAGPCISTMMYSARWSDTEGHVQNLLSSLTNIELTDDQKLRITGANDERFFERYESERPGPITEVRFL